jgi:hypothetical protein
MPTLRD